MQDRYRRTIWDGGNAPEINYDARLLLRELTCIREIYEYRTEDFSGRRKNMCWTSVHDSDLKMQS
jgi:hypothetical protein